MTRREFLKLSISGMASFTLSGMFGSRLEAGEARAKREFMGVLVDTTRCIGCRSCELACAEAHGLPIPNIDDASVFSSPRNMDPSHWTVVQRYKTEKGEIFVKRQCMHCNQPACVAACLVRAMKKREEGPVTWDENCMGCRYCMVSCPFDVPKFEYDKAFGRIMKCNMCYERLRIGKIPACVEACPSEALLFGRRRDLLHEAKRRIYGSTGRYFPHVYGETDVGGTGYLYLSAVPFERIGFRTDLGTKAYPEYTTGFLYSVPIVLILWPAFLTGIHHLTKEKKRKEVER